MEPEGESGATDPGVVGSVGREDAGVIDAVIDPVLESRIPESGTLERESRP